MGGRTMVHQMNTPTKYSVIHGTGAGLFASYNRSIPKTNVQNHKIRINNSNFHNKNEIVSLRDSSPGQANK